MNKMIPESSRVHRVDPRVEVKLSVSDWRYSITVTCKKHDRRRSAQPASVGSVSVFSEEFD